MGRTIGSVGILVASRMQRKNVLRQYLPHNKTGLKLFCFMESSIDWSRRRIVGLHRMNGRWAIGEFAFPSVVYNRCYGKGLQTIERLAAAIGGDHCFNHINRFDKLDIYRCLSNGLGDFLPHTAAFDKEQSVLALIRHKEIFFKPLYGNRGVGVYRAELQPSGEVHVGHHYFTPEIIFNSIGEFQEHINTLVEFTPFIVQKGVRIMQVDERAFDIRALLQKDGRGRWSVTNLVSRVAFKGSYNTSIFEKACLTREVLERLYPQGTVRSVLRSLEAIGLKAAEILDADPRYRLGEFCVDFALDNDGRAWIIELNGQPQKDIYDEIADQCAVYERPLQYARYLSGR